MKKKHFDFVVEKFNLKIGLSMFILRMKTKMIEVKDADGKKIQEQHKRFSKQTKLERTLTEVIDQLKSWRQEIKLTEVEWDF